MFYLMTHSTEGFLWIYDYIRHMAKDRFDINKRY